MNNLANMAARAEAIHDEVARLQRELIAETRHISMGLYAEAAAHLNYASNSSFWLTAALRAAAAVSRPAVAMDPCGIEAAREAMIRG